MNKNNKTLTMKADQRLFLLGIIHSADHQPLLTPTQKEDNSTLFLFVAVVVMGVLLYFLN